MSRAGRVFAQPIQDQARYSNRFIGSSFQRVVFGLSELDIHWNLSKCGEISLDPARSCQIHPKSDEISSDPTGFLPNHDEKSLVRPDPMFIVPEFDKIK